MNEIFSPTMTVMGVRALGQEIHLNEQKRNDLGFLSLDAFHQLTPRQIQVCQLIAMEGLTNKEAAIRLSEKLGRPISVRTIERHRDNINKKLGRNKLAWIRYLKQLKE